MNTEKRKIKGSSKQVVILTEPGSKLFEQAIFIMKQEDGACSADLLSEAERIINAHIFSSAMLPSRRRPKGWLPVLAVSITVSLLVGLSVLLFVLL